MSDTTIVAEIEHLEAKRRQAMLSRDVDALQGLLHDDLIYMHSSGVSDTKDSYIEGLKSGVWNYQRIDFSGRLIKTHGHSAVVFSRLSMSILNRGVPKEVESSALAVWATAAGAWQLVAVLSGAVLPPTPSDA